ncbi:MAG: hypothetical protein PHD05_00025 [Sphaerochaetaceae bacterium]|jgi:hypothetical protein|nr:hypothetical protein [Sphaerochaetaceae bacterium]
MDNPFDTPPESFLMQTGSQPPVETAETIKPPQSDDFGSVPVTTPESSSFVNPFGNNPFGGQTPGGDQTTQSPKYAITDFFWLINPKFYIKENPVQSEAHVAIISFNASFGNLRVSFYNLTKNSFQGHVIFYENLKRLVTGTIYPASAFNILNSKRLTSTCLEQLFRQIPGANWQQERPACLIEKTEEKIRLTIKDPKFGTYFYDFIDWQKNAFLYACNFICSKGFEFSIQQQLNK